MGADTFTAEVPKEIEEHSEYINWESQADGSQLIKLEATKEKIKNEGLLTSAKDLRDGLYEKKWKSGLRLYFAVVENENGKRTLLLLGSGKGRDQNRAIQHAKKALDGYKVIKSSIRFNSNN